MILGLLLWLAWPGVEVYADYSTVVLADSPYAYYRFGESSGTSAADSSGNGRNGSYVNSPTLGATGALAGDADTAVTFTGASSQSVSCPITGIGSLMGSGISFEAWFKTTTTSAMRIFGERSGAAGTQHIQVVANLNSAGSNVAGDVYAGFQASDGKNCDAATTVTAGIHDGAWHHIVCTWTASTNTTVIYIDGVSRTVTYAAQSTPASFANFPNALRIGAWDQGGSVTSFFTGSIDEAAVYTSVLTAAKVRTHYAAGLGIFGGGGGSPEFRKGGGLRP